MNRRGPSIDPCGTPVVSNFMLDMMFVLICMNTNEAPFKECNLVVNSTWTFFVRCRSVQRLHCLREWPRVANYRWTAAWTVLQHMWAISRHSTKWYDCYSDVHSTWHRWALCLHTSTELASVLESLWSGSFWRWLFLLVPIINEYIETCL